MSGIKLMGVFVCSVGSTATFQTPSGTYIYHIDKWLAEDIKKKGKHQPGKMLNVAKKCAYSTSKIN